MFEFLSITFLISGLYIIWKLKKGEKIPIFFYLPIAASVVMTCLVISEGVRHSDQFFLAASSFVCASSWIVGKLWYGAFGRDIRRIVGDLRGRS